MRTAFAEMAFDDLVDRELELVEGFPAELETAV